MEVGITGLGGAPGTSGSYAWGGGTGVVCAAVSFESATAVVTAITFDGVTLNLIATIAHSDGSNTVALYGAEITRSAANYMFSYSTSTGTSNASHYLWRVDDAASTPEDDSTAEASNSVATISTTVSCVPDGAVLAVFHSGSAGITWDSYAGVSERLELNETNYTTTFADALTTTTESRTVSATASGTGGNKVMATVSFAPASSAPSSSPKHRRRIVGHRPRAKMAPRSRNAFASILSGRSVTPSTLPPDYYTPRSPSVMFPDAVSASVSFPESVSPTVSFTP